MAEAPNDKNSPAATPAPESPPSVLDSLAIKDELDSEELDKFLNEADPEFAGAVKEISGDKSLSLSEININDEQSAIHSEIDFWQSQTGLLKLVYKAIPIMPRISLLFKRVKTRVSDVAIAGSIRARNLMLFIFMDGRRMIVGKISSQLRALSEDIRYNRNQFQRLSLKIKMTFVLAGIFVIAAVAVAYIAWTRGLLPREEPLFVSSIESIASEKNEISPNDDSEYFYDNLRATQNVILIEKMIVNIRKSKSSGPNPMAAFEFFIEGTNSDVVVEIKDREVMVRDLMMRTLEELDFDTLESTEGKHEMADRLQKHLNQILTTGHVKNIRIKSVILKP